MKRDAFRNLTNCNKMFDFIAMGKPAIVSRTRSVEAYFDEDSFRWFTAGRADDLAEAIRDLYADRALGERLARHASEVAEPYRWPHQREIYLNLIDRLLDADTTASRTRLRHPAGRATSTTPSPVQPHDRTVTDGGR